MQANRATRRCPRFRVPTRRAATRPELAARCVCGLGAVLARGPPLGPRPIPRSLSLNHTPGLCPPAFTIEVANCRHDDVINDLNDRHLPDGSKVQSAAMTAPLQDALNEHTVKATFTHNPPLVIPTQTMTYLVGGKTRSPVFELSSPGTGLSALWSRNRIRQRDRVEHPHECHTRASPPTTQPLRPPAGALPFRDDRHSALRFVGG